MLLDANALFLPFRSGVPLLRELERLAPGRTAAVPSSVLGELDRLCERGIRDGVAARAFARTFPKVVATGRGDAALLRTAVATGAWVVTADRGLVESLRAHGIAVLVPRDRSRLELRRGRPVGVRAPPSPASAARRRGRISTTVKSRARLVRGRNRDARRRSDARPP